MHAARPQGHTWSNEIRSPLPSTKSKGDGIFQPRRLADATVAPAGPAAAWKGLLARPTVTIAFLQAALKSSLPTSPSHTALAHSTVGPVAISVPTSNAASCSRAKDDLPRISPATAQENLLAALTAVSVAPQTPTPYRIAGAAPVRTSLPAALLPRRLYRPSLPATAFNLAR